MRMTSFVEMACFTAVLLVPGLGRAHSRLVSPPSRSVDTGLTLGPCGGIPPTGMPTAFLAGSTISVEIAVDISHGDHFRIAFSPADDMGFDSNVLADGIPDTMSATSLMQDVTLPSIACDACTLQLLQYATNGTNYYSCADIRLIEGGGPGTGGGGSGGSTGGTATTSGGGMTTAEDTDAGTTGVFTTGVGSQTTTASTTSPTTGSASSSTTDSGGQNGNGSSGGCGCRSSGLDPAMAFGLLGVLAFVRRRRR